MFIRVTSKVTELAAFIRIGEINQITGHSEGGSEVMCSNTRPGYCFLCKETPEEIMQMIEGKAETPAPALQFYLPEFCGHCGSTTYQIITDSKGVFCTDCGKYLVYDNSRSFRPPMLQELTAART
jgi:hypothetical protein